MKLGCAEMHHRSHIYFLDDFLILMKTDITNATFLQQVLDTYCANLGQLVSFGKVNHFLLAQY
jgi:hypothetical protein